MAIGDVICEAELRKRSAEQDHIGRRWRRRAGQLFAAVLSLDPLHPDRSERLPVGNRRHQLAGDNPVLKAGSAVEKLTRARHIHCLVQTFAGNCDFVSVAARPPFFSRTILDAFLGSFGWGEFCATAAEQSATTTRKGSQRAEFIASPIYRQIAVAQSYFA